jgi:hypothetical protein
MFKSIVRLTFKCLVLGILIGGLWFYSGYSFSQVVPPRIVVAPQPGSPLLVLPTFVDAPNPLSPRYGYSITNVTEKPISAFAIQESASWGPGTPISSTNFAHFPAVKLFLGPHESKQEDGGIGRLYQRPPVEVSLLVDFVEFADGTRWGQDTSGSGEMLDGKRAGGRAAVRKYREILAAGGLRSLEQALADPSLVSPENVHKSDAWLRGFNMGVTSATSRLARAKKKNGEDELRRELDRPFDSTDGRQEP